MSAQPGPVWFTVPPTRPHTCTCWPRKVYLLMHERPVFLKPSETTDYTPEELAEYRTEWAKP